MNKEKEFSWKYGQNNWSRVNNFIVDDETGKVLDIKGSNQTLEAEVVLWSKVLFTHRAHDKILVYDFCIL